MNREMLTPSVMAGLVQDEPGHDGGERAVQMLLLIADRRAGHLAVAERAELLPYGTITSPHPGTHRSA